MKHWLSMGLSSVILFGFISSVQAEDDMKKQQRNDRISVHKGIAQFDINPFSDRKRKIRNDHISYSTPKIEAKSNETRKSFKRNDRVTVSKSIDL